MASPLFDLYVSGSDDEKQHEHLKYYYWMAAQTIIVGDATKDVNLLSLNSVGRLLIGIQNILSSVMWLMPLIHWAKKTEHQSFPLHYSKLARCNETTIKDTGVTGQALTEGSSFEF